MDAAVLPRTYVGTASHAPTAFQPFIGFVHRRAAAAGGATRRASSRPLPPGRSSGASRRCGSRQTAAASVTYGCAPLRAARRRQRPAVGFYTPQAPAESSFRPCASPSPGSSQAQAGDPYYGGAAGRARAEVQIPGSVHGGTMSFLSPLRTRGAVSPRPSRSAPSFFLSRRLRPLRRQLHEPRRAGGGRRGSAPVAALARARPLPARARGVAVGVRAAPAPTLNVARRPRPVPRHRHPGFDARGRRSCRLGSPRHRRRSASFLDHSAEALSRGGMIAFASEAFVIATPTDDRRTDLATRLGVSAAPGLSGRRSATRSCAPIGLALRGAARERGSRRSAPANADLEEAAGRDRAPLLRHADARLRSAARRRAAREGGRRPDSRSRSGRRRDPQAQVRAVQARDPGAARSGHAAPDRRPTGGHFYEARDAASSARSTRTSASG